MYTFSGLAADILMATLAIFAIFVDYGQLEMVCYGYNVHICMVEYWNSGLNADHRCKQFYKRWINQKLMTKTKNKVPKPYYSGHFTSKNEHKLKMDGQARVSHLKSWFFCDSLNPFTAVKKLPMCNSKKFNFRYTQIWKLVLQK